jgi:hypothetical protein
MAKKRRVGRPTLPPGEALVRTSTRVPVATLKRLERIAKGWHVSTSSLIRTLVVHSSGTIEQIAQTAKERDVSPASLIRALARPKETLERPESDPEKGTPS